MTSESFRRAALALPETVESAHMNHPDFRVANKIFSTLGYPDTEWGMVQLPPEEQRRLVEAMPDVFTPAKGKWGENGSTMVRLAKARADVVEHALEMAWRHAQAKQTPVKRPKRAL